MAAPDVSIVVVNWHSRDYVRACADALRRTTTCGYQLIVVDNASYDGCLEMLGTDFPDAVAVQSPINAGFAAANNLGLQHVTGRFVLFLNPDTIALDGAIDGMVDALQRHPQIGPLGARLLNTDRTLQTSCVQALPTLLNQLLAADLLIRVFPRARLWKVDALLTESPEVVPVEAVSGACLMMESELCRRLGGFSESFFMYGEDMDLCARARALGHPVGHLSTAVVVHHGGGSSRTQPSAASVRMMRDALETYFTRNHGRTTAAAYRASSLVAAAARLAVLVLAWPAWVATRGLRNWREVVSKWLTVLRWSCRPRLSP